MYMYMYGNEKRMGKGESREISGASCAISLGVAMLTLLPTVGAAFAPLSVSATRCAVQRVPPPVLSEFLPPNVDSITPLFDNCLVDLQVSGGNRNQLKIPSHSSSAL